LIEEDDDAADDDDIECRLCGSLDVMFSFSINIFLDFWNYSLAMKDYCAKARKYVRFFLSSNASATYVLTISSNRTSVLLYVSLKESIGLYLYFGILLPDTGRTYRVTGSPVTMGGKKFGLQKFLNDVLQGCAPGHWTAH